MINVASAPATGNPFHSVSPLVFLSAKCSAMAKKGLLNIAEPGIESRPPMGLRMASTSLLNSVIKTAAVSCAQNAPMQLYSLLQTHIVRFSNGSPVGIKAVSQLIIYISKLFLSSKKSISPIIRIPFSFRHGLMFPFTMTIFPKESSILSNDCSS